MDDKNNNAREEEQLEIDLSDIPVRETPPPGTEPAEETAPPSDGENFEQLAIDGAAEAPPKKRSGKKKVVFFAVFFLICAASIAVTAFNDFAGGEETLPFGEILSVIGGNWYYLVLAAVSCLLVLAFDWLKTALLLYGFKRQFRLKLTAQTAVITKFYDYVTPFGSGGQPFAAYLLAKNGVDAGTSTAVVVSCFLLQQFAFIILCILSLIFSFHVIPTATQAMSIVGLISYLAVPVLVVVFSIMPKATTKIVTGIIRFGGRIKLLKNPEKTAEKAIAIVSKNAACLKNIGKNKLTLVLAAVCAFASQLAMASIAYFTLKTFAYDIPANGFLEWLQMVQIVIILYASVAFIPTPGNAGASELSFYFIFKTNLAGGLGFTGMIVWRILCFYAYLVIGAVVALAGTKHERRAKKKAKTKNASPQ